jgi:hypothetical protein
MLEFSFRENAVTNSTEHSVPNRVVGITLTFVVYGEKPGIPT